MKRLLLDNLATKAMALFLALLTWAYLFTQGLSDEKIVVEFHPPELDPKVFASVTYWVSEDQELKPNGEFEVEISGPKADVKASSSPSSRGRRARRSS